MISIVVPTYNRARLLARLLDSLLRQSDQRFELVVVDDGSTDGTPLLVEGFGPQFGSRMVRVRHSRSQGCNAARNTGVRAARTEWCLFLDSDWELLQDGAHRAIGHTEVPARVGAVAFLSLHLPDNVVRGYRASDPTWETVRIPYEDIVLKRHTPGGMFWLIRKSVFQDDGLWLPEWINGMEELFAARLARHRDIVAVREVLGVAHFDPGEDHISVKRRRRWPREFGRGYQVFLAENYDVLRHDIRRYRRVLQCLMHCSLYSGAYGEAMVWGSRAIYWKVHLGLRCLRQAVGPRATRGRGTLRRSCMGTTDLAK